MDSQARNTKAHEGPAGLRPVLTGKVRSGSGVHGDRRTKRNRTRAEQKRRAIERGEQ